MYGSYSTCFYKLINWLNIFFFFFLEKLAKYFCVGCPLFLISFGDCLWSLLLFFNIFVNVYITSQTIFWVCVSYVIQNVKFQSAYLVHCELYPTSDNFFKVYSLTQICTPPLSYGPHIAAYFTDLHCLYLSRHSGGLW